MDTKRFDGLDADVRVAISIGVANGLPFEDQYLFNANGTDLPGPLWGVGIHGAVSPSSLFLFAPRTEAGQLPTAAELRGILSGELPIPAGCAVLLPGEVVRFDYPLQYGGRVVGLPLDAGVDSDQYENASDPRWPANAPLVRHYLRDPGPAPSRLSLQRVAGFAQVDFLGEDGQANGGDIPTGLAVSGVSSKAMALSPQTRTVAIQIFNASTQLRLTTESVDVEIWWRLASGFWCHNPDDDFKAGYRGQATATHDYEIYDVPGLARHVLARVPAGGNSNLGCFYVTSEG